MQTWHTRHIAATAVVGLVLLAGCGPRGSDEPMLTDGPNQVVLKVPGMS